MQCMLKKLISLFLAVSIVQLLPIVEFSTVISFVITTLILYILLYAVEPILNLFSLPLHIATFGFFRVIIIIFSIWIARFLVPGFVIYPMIFLGYNVPYLLTLVFVSIVIRSFSSLIHKVLQKLLP